MLTQVKYPEAAGTANIEWDAVRIKIIFKFGKLILGPVHLEALGGQFTSSVHIHVFLYSTYTQFFISKPFARTQ